jgi:hypothetical protein
MEANATHLHSSVAIPRNTRVLTATYRLRLHVGNIPLSQLTLDLPEGLKTSQGIEVVNQMGQTIEAIATFSGHKVMIAFAQPVPPYNLLRLDLKGVHTLDRLGRTWFVPVSGRSMGMATDIPLGTARFQTSK